MFSPLSIFEKDVFERDGFDLLARDDGQEPSFRAMLETARISLFLVRNRDKMNKRCEERTSEAPRCLPTPVPTAGGAGRPRAGLPGNVEPHEHSPWHPSSRPSGATSRPNAGAFIHGQSPWLSAAGVNMITGSALTPLRESVSALSAL